MDTFKSPKKNNHWAQKSFGVTFDDQSFEIHLNHLLDGGDNAGGVNAGPGHQLGRLAGAGDAGHGERGDLGAQAMQAHHLGNG